MASKLLAKCNIRTTSMPSISSLPLPTLGAGQAQTAGAFAPDRIEFPLNEVDKVCPR